MMLSEWLNTTQKLLVKTSTTPRLDAEVLLCDELQVNKAWLLAHGDNSLQGLTLQKLEKQVARRVAGEPLAYIRGFAEFYGRRFEVNEHVLVPRPESETMIELLLQGEGFREKASGSTKTIIDVGTGSGALGITAILELDKLPSQRFSLSPFLIDIDQNCLKVAKKNAKTFGIEAKCLQGNLLDPFLQDPRSKIQDLVILANLPYVPDDYEINDAAKHEPKLALFAGQDGLDLYREMFKQIEDRGSKIEEVTIYTESLLFQHDELRKIAEEAGFTQTEEKDLIQVFANKK